MWPVDLIVLSSLIGGYENALHHVHHKQGCSCSLLRSCPQVRDAAVPEEATKMKMSDLAGCLRPVGHVHIGMCLHPLSKRSTRKTLTVEDSDHAPRAIVGRVQSLHVAGDDSNFLLRGRVRVIKLAAVLTCCSYTGSHTNARVKRVAPA